MIWKEFVRFKKMVYGMVYGMVLVRLSGFGCLNVRYVIFSDDKIKLKTIKIINRIRFTFYA